MTVFIAAIVIFFIAFLGLSLGVILKDKQIKGHCGGVPTVTDSCERDEHGNKIASCSSCSCESEPV